MHVCERNIQKVRLFNINVIVICVFHIVIAAPHSPGLFLLLPYRTQYYLACAAPNFEGDIAFPGTHDLHIPAMQGPPISHLSCHCVGAGPVCIQ
jgi:hypothetical protein